MTSPSPELGHYPPEYMGDVYFTPKTTCMPPDNAKTFAALELRRDLKNLPAESFLLVDEEFAAISDMVTSAHFSRIPGFEQTRQESAQGVEFGELIFTTYDGAKYGEHVALKPFDTPTEAAHEMGAMLTVNERVELCRRRPASFSPLGIYRFGNGEYGLLTRFDFPVRTQDNTFWNPSRQPTEHEVNKALAQGAFSLATLHLHGYAHGDKQVKNVAADSRGVRFVDLAQMRRIGDGVPPSTAASRVRDDLSKYLSSLAARTGEGSGDLYGDNIKEVFAPRYQRLVEVPGSPVPEDARFPIEEIVELADHV